MKFEELQEILSAILEVDVQEISRETVHEDLEKWDSMAHMTIVSALEEQTGMYFSEEEIVEMLSVEGILDVLGRGLD